jgi:transposase, IS5 family
MKQLARTLRRRTGVAMAEVDRLTAQVARLARQTVREVEVVAGNARRTLARRPGDGRLAPLVGELEETIIHTGRLLAQTDQRLAGNQVIPDRLGSLADPDARPIRKGKPRAPDPVRRHPAVGRGRTRVHRRPPAAAGRPTGCTPAGPGGQTGHRGHRPAARDGGRRPRVRHRRQRPSGGSLGRQTGRVAADRHPRQARLALERTRRFRRLRNWRVGVQAQISHLKCSFGLRRTRLRRRGGARTWVGLGIFADNLQRMTVITQ